MKGRTYSILASLCLLAIGVFFLYLANADPVLFSFVDLGGMHQVPSWSLLNPLRNRAPERPAEALLRALKEGKAKEVLGLSKLETLKRDHIVESEQQFKITSWRLVIRKDTPNKSLLIYNVARGNFQVDPNCPVSIFVEKPLGAKSWRLTFIPYCY